MSSYWIREAEHTRKEPRHIAQTFSWGLFSVSFCVPQIASNSDHCSRPLSRKRGRAISEENHKQLWMKHQVS